MRIPVADLDPSTVWSTSAMASKEMEEKAGSWAAPRDGDASPVTVQAPYVETDSDSEIELEVRHSPAATSTAWWRAFVAM